MSIAQVKKKVLMICLLAVLVCSLYYLVKCYFFSNYFIESLTKVILFGGGASLLYFLLEKKDPHDLVTLKTGAKMVGISIGLGILLMLILWTAYFLLRKRIDLDNIILELSKNAVNPKSFPYVAIYITLGNSFLEEFFFRGFIFLQLYEMNFKKIAYLVSAVFFSIYHMAIFQAWFSYEVAIVALFGLFLGDLMFCYIDTKCSSIINSWIIHGCLDISIMVIGYIMFYC